MRWLWMFVLMVALAGALIAVDLGKSKDFGRAFIRIAPFLALMVFVGWRLRLPLFVTCIVVTMPLLFFLAQHTKGCLNVLVYILPLVLIFGGLAIWEARDEALLKSGVTASAKVLEVRDLSTSVGPDPMIELRLQVLPSGGAPYEVETKQVVSRLSMDYYRPGAMVQVKYDPKKPTRLVVYSVQTIGLP